MSYGFRRAEESVGTGIASLGCSLAITPSDFTIKEKPLERKFQRLFYKSLHLLLFFRRGDNRPLRKFILGIQTLDLFEN